MNVDVSVLKSMSLKHQRQLNALDSLFPKEGLGFTWSEPSYHIVGCVEGELVGHIGFGRYLVKINEVLVPVIGVGGVVVQPSYQGKNIPAHLFSALHSTTALNATGGVFTLFCPNHLVSYYQKHGYTLDSRQVPFYQEGEMVTSNFNFMRRGTLAEGRIWLTTAPW